LNLFDRDRAAVAVFSTFNFDPVFFEARILNSKALEQARRVVVFLDATEYQRLQTEGAVPRYLNRRYLVVPVKPARGVFHSKLSLLVSPDTAHVLCGSNNLTQAGCTHNLELLNYVSTDFESCQATAHCKLLSESLRFFKAVAKLGVGHAARIATQWLQDLAQDAPWLNVTQDKSEGTIAIQLVSTVDQSIWDWLGRTLGSKIPSRVTVISPFYDARLAPIARLRKQWPRCTVDLVAQQHYSNIPVAGLNRYAKSVRLHELITAKGRHAHAKLIAFHLKGRTVCLAGSANFTAGAFDGANVETCLAWEQDGDPVTALFDGEIHRAPIKAQDFIAAPEPPPEEQSKPKDMVLSIDDAYLNGDGKLNVGYELNLREKPERLTLRVRLAGQQQPAWTANLPRAGGRTSLELPEGLRAQMRDAASCSLATAVHGEPIFSPEVWIIQESYLTREDDTLGGTAEIEREIRETGRGLVEHLDDLGGRVGVRQVIDYLRNLSIRYSSGEDGRRGSRIGFSVKAHNPLRPDSLPKWVLEIHSKSSLEAALYDFFERHEKRILWRHVRTGNINGISNFLDVFRTMVRLLFIYYRRNVIPREQLIGRICEWLKIFFVEADENETEPEGYLVALAANYEAEILLLRSQLVKDNIAGNMYAALLIAQRAVFERSQTGNPFDYLPTFRQRLTNGLKNVGLSAPSSKALKDALKEFQILADKDVVSWIAHM